MQDCEVCRTLWALRPRYPRSGSISRATMVRGCCTQSEEQPELQLRDPRSRAGRGNDRQQEHGHEVRCQHTDALEEERLGRVCVHRSRKRCVQKINGP